MEPASEGIGFLGAIWRSIKGVGAGVVLVGVSFPLIFWNEGRARQTTLSLDEGLSAVVSIDPGAPSPDHEGKLVWFTGKAHTDEVLSDPTFGVRQQAIGLRRTVEVYQWLQTESSENKPGGNGTRKVFSYRTDWHEGLVNHRSFNTPKGHENPTTAAYSSLALQAQDVRVGALRLDPVLIGQMNDWQTVTLDDEADRARPLEVGQPSRRDDRWIFGDDPDRPRVGDLRVGFGAVPPAVISVVARQKGQGTDGYPTQAGDVLAMVEYGAKSPAEMFALAESRNQLLTWGLRALAYVVLFGGLRLMVAPIRLVASVVPVFGTWIGMFMTAIAASVAFVLWGGAVAVAWIAVRPLLAVALLVGAASAAVIAGVLLAMAVGAARSRTET
jgi:hypothetical protein